MCASYHISITFATAFSAQASISQVKWDYGRRTYTCFTYIIHERNPHDCTIEFLSLSLVLKNVYTKEVSLAKKKKCECKRFIWRKRNYMPEKCVPKTQFCIASNWIISHDRCTFWSGFFFFFLTEVLLNLILEDYFYGKRVSENLGKELREIYSRKCCRNNTRFCYQHGFTSTSCLMLLQVSLSTYYYLPF